MSRMAALPLVLRNQVQAPTASAAAATLIVEGSGITDIVSRGDWKKLSTVVPGGKESSVRKLKPKNCSAAARVERKNAVTSNTGSGCGREALKWFEIGKVATGNPKLTSPKSSEPSPVYPAQRPGDSGLWSWLRRCYG